MINYYILDSIVKRDGSYYGTKNGIEVEVYLMDGTDDETLIAQGFAKCDAPGWNETMLIEEAAWMVIA